MRPYQAVFNRQALEFVADADEETYAEIEQWVNRIERAPSSRGDYTEQDEDLPTGVTTPFVKSVSLASKRVEAGEARSKKG